MIRARRSAALGALLLLVTTPALAAPTTTDPDPWLGPDKGLHFGVSAGIAGAGYGATALFTNDIRLRIVFGASLAVAAGAAKELYDMTGAGDPSWKDFTWDLIGTVVGIGVSIAIDFGIRAFAAPAPASSR